MPIKDKEKAKEYKRLWIAKKRKGVASHDNVEPRKVFVEPLKNVEPVEPIKLKVEPETMSNPVEPCSKCLKLNKENDRRLLALNKDKERLQWEVDSCNRLHKIPKEADFIDLMWDRRYKKFIFYGCADSCWTGGYCNSCSSLEQQIEKRINQKTNEQSTNSFKRY